MSQELVRPENEEGEIFREGVATRLFFGEGELCEFLMRLRTFLENHQDVESPTYLNPNWVEILRALMGQRIPMMRTNTTDELFYAYLVFKEGLTIPNQWKAYLAGRDGETYFSVYVEDGTVPVNFKSLIRYFEGPGFDNWLSLGEEVNENEFEEDDSDE